MQQVAHLHVAVAVEGDLRAGKIHGPAVGVADDLHFVGPVGQLSRQGGGQRHHLRIGCPQQLDELGDAAGGDLRLVALDVQHQVVIGQVQRGSGLSQPVRAGSAGPAGHHRLAAEALDRPHDALIVRRDDDAVDAVSQTDRFDNVLNERPACLGQQRLARQPR